MKTDPRLSWWHRLADGRSPHAYALIFWLLSLVLFREPLISLARLSFHDELASHVLLIPLISAFLIYLERTRIFRVTHYCPSAGVPALLIAAILWFGLKSHVASLNPVDRLSVSTALIVLVWVSGFVLIYGSASSRSAVFPLLFLFLMSPLPLVVTDYLTSILQKGSADICYALFRAIGVPVSRHGFQFSLPGVDIEVAEQCSGIHAGLALFIAGVLAEHFLLQNTWKKLCFILCIFPIAVFKNAVRIVTISWLGIHVNSDFFQGALHRRGGLPFSLLALAMMAILLWLLRLPAALPERKPQPDRLLESSL